MGLSFNQVSAVGVAGTQAVAQNTQDVQAMTAPMDSEALQIFNTPLPPHNLTIDQNRFRLALANSQSFGFTEKMQIIQNLPYLQQPQAEGLLKLLEKEATDSQKYLDEHLVAMKKIDTARIEAEEELEKEMHDGLISAEDRMKLTRLRQDLDRDV